MHFQMKKSTKNSQKSQGINKQEENTKRFLRHVRRVCEELDIKLDLRRARKIKLSPTIACSGYFDEESRVLAVAMKAPDALGILVHEYCHLTQYLDYLDGKFRLWKSATNALGKLDAWLSGEPITNLKRVITYSRELELDNEKRSVAMIQKWNLPVDLDDYIKKANAYVLFYNWMHKTRKWSVPSNTPYTNPLVLDTMSSKFNMKYTTLSRNVHKAFVKSGI